MVARILVSIVAVSVAFIVFANQALADCAQESVDVGVALDGLHDYEAYVQEGNSDMASLSWETSVHEIDVAQNDDGTCADDAKTNAEYADMQLHYWADAIRRGADHPTNSEDTWQITWYIRQVYNARENGTIDEPDWSDLALVIKPYADKYHLPLMPKSP